MQRCLSGSAAVAELGAVIFLKVMPELAKRLRFFLVGLDRMHRLVVWIEADVKAGQPAYEIAGIVFAFIILTPSDRAEIWLVGEVLLDPLKCAFEIVKRHVLDCSAVLRPPAISANQSLGMPVRTSILTN